MKFGTDQQGSSWNSLLALFLIASLLAPVLSSQFNLLSAKQERPILVEDPVENEERNENNGPEERELEECDQMLQAVAVHKGIQHLPGLSTGKLTFDYASHCSDIHTPPPELL